MQTIIQQTDSYSADDNVVFPVASPGRFKTPLLTSGEHAYIRDRFRENQHKTFVFNRLTHIVFVVIVDPAGSRVDRVQRYRDAGAKLQSLINEFRLQAVVIADTENKPDEALAFSEGLALRNYQFIKYRSKKEDKLHSLSVVYLHSHKMQPGQIDRLNILLDSVSRCRDLVNEPVAWLNAPKLAEEFQRMGKESGAAVEVFNKKKIESLKMGGLLAVNKGSIDPPTFTIMEWKPEHPINKKPYVFVGKGVVFDTGGMNLKTGSVMNDMKMDMAGGAAVASALYAIARAGLPAHVVALIPATDNRTNGNAYVNGDIITMYDGSTVEVINTDAEGRMILADALSFAKKYNPELVINVATLTGSAMRAIGTHGIVAMQANASREFRELAAAGEKVYERLVEFPFWKEYEEELKSEVADVKHLGGSNAGAITAGKFLERFTDYPFIHLDIAGPAFLEKPSGIHPAGGTGITVRLLFQFILSKIQPN